MARARPREGLEEQRTLAAVEAGLFGRRPRPLTLARYVLLERLGSGGAGVVFRAYDPHLDRKVAVKLLRADVDAAGVGRLAAEAQALARLAHPNVIAVHDVGSYAETDLGVESGAEAEDLEVPARGLFVVMEMVPGKDLGTWLTAHPRSLREILDVMGQAGRGLSAAHAAGLVHGDFKPGNVLVGDDRRVRVVDFGLARPAEASGAVFTPMSPDPMATTDTGSGQGTPPYMAPEQHRGLPPDKRSDQYAFAVTLFRAVNGTNPFSGKGDEMLRAKQAGPSHMPRPGRAPRWLEAVIDRALAPEPERRFSSMDALLAALARNPALRRRRILAGFSGALALGALALLARGSGGDPCGDAGARWSKVWDSNRLAGLEQALLGSGAAGDAQKLSRVAVALDEHGQRWQSAWRGACQELRAPGAVPEAAVHARLACLGRDLQETEAVIAELAHADASMLEHAVVGLRSLGRLETCADASLGGRAALPADAATRGRVEALRSRMGRGRAAHLAGRFADAESAATEVAGEAARLGYAPLEAEAFHLLASSMTSRGSFADAEQRFLEAIWKAEGSREEEVAVDAWISLAWVVGVEQGRTEEGHRWAAFAAAAVERVGGDLRRASLTHCRAGIFYRERKLSRALELYQEALAAQERLLGPDNPHVATTLNHIGNVLMAQNRLDEASVACRRSLEIRRRVLGDDHPLVAAALNNLAQIAIQGGRAEEANERAREALAIVEGSGGPHEGVSWRIVSMAEERLGRIPVAAQAAERALAILQRTRPGDEKAIEWDRRRRADLMARMEAGR